MFYAVKDFKERKQKYCSVECWSKRGAYRKATCVGCRKVGLGKYGKQYCSRECAFRFSKNAWKGDKAGYSAIHKWMAANFGKAHFCAHCGATKRSGKRMQWANLDGKYTRDLADWLPLCSMCHMTFDGTKADVSLRWAKYTDKEPVRDDGVKWSELSSAVQ